MQTTSSQTIREATLPDGTVLRFAVDEEIFPRWEGVELYDSLVSEGRTVRTRRTGLALQELHELGGKYLLAIRPLGPDGRRFKGAPEVREISQFEAIRIFMDWHGTDLMTETVLNALRGEAKLAKIKGRMSRVEIRGGLAQALIGQAEARGVTEEALLHELLLAAVRGGGR
ncbi:MAG: hypothetical protein J0M24_19825 [Verrucomicrobia bacterium]|nr:hypothetical protein [Verrucomicrobiota bacterium]